MLIIGSKALNKKIKLNRKLSIDIDLIASENETIEIIKFLKRSKIQIDKIERKNDKVFIFLNRKKGKTILEIELTSRESSNLIMKYENAENCIKYASLNTLYLLKTSHKYLKNSPHFLKTMNDIHLMRENNAYIENKEILKLREKETYNYSLPKLNQSKEDFFEKKEDFYIYDHDDIHKAIKFSEKPAYEYFKDEEREVFCSKEKFYKCSEYIKKSAVLEESLVLALERSQIPFEFKPDRRKSFKTALMKVCTSITSGWFREYAWENYYNVIEMYNSIGQNYIEKFKEALQRGEISEFKK